MVRGGAYRPGSISSASALLVALAGILNHGSWNGFPWGHENGKAHLQIEGDEMKSHLDILKNQLEP
jgi:hypothetical protein